MYLYCANNPINNVDPTGKSILIGVVIGITTLIFTGATITQAIINGNQLNNAEEMFIAGITASRPSSSTLNNLANKAKNSPAIKNEVKKAITYSKGKNFNNYESNEVVFSGGDLGLAIGKVTKTTISGMRNQDNSWNINITLFDKYNFEEWRRMNSFGNIANNFGLIMEKTGLLTPYDWDISFSFKYYEE